MPLTSNNNPNSLKLVDIAQGRDQLPTCESAGRHNDGRQAMSKAGDTHANAEQYEQWMRQRNLSEKTIYQWNYVLRKFTDWYGADPLEATRADIEAWIYVAQPNLSAASQRNYGHGMASFYRWAIREGKTVADPTKDLQPPKEPIYVPDPCPTRLVRKAMDTASPFMRGVIACAAFQGMRCAEISALRWQDIEGDEMLVHGKGRKQRRLPLHSETAAALDVLGRGHDHVFGGVTPHQISDRGSRFLRAIGVTTRMPMHSLRSWYATTLYQSSGHDLLLVRNMLGHSSTEHTARYAKVADSAALSAVKGIAA